MKKIIFLVIVAALSISSCLPQPEATALPTPDLKATAAVLSQQTLDALPTATLVPSNTPQVSTPTTTPTQPTPTETQNPVLLTLTATLGTGTVAANNGSPTIVITPGSPTVTVTGTVPSVTSTLPNITGVTATGTAHLQYSGTMPPNLPYGKIDLINRSKAEVYISMRCVTKEGYVTIIEYPVKNSVIAKAPAGKYTYVVWVGGKKIDGSFSLGASNDLTITIYKDRVTVK